MRPKKLMIVEDEGLIAQEIALNLESAGYEILAICQDGEEVLRSLEASLPDLIVMDIHLQGALDGVDVAVRVRAKYGIPVVFLTAHADADTVARAGWSHHSGYLVKPFRTPALIRMIEMALSARTIGN